MEHLRSYRWVGVQSFIREFEAFPRAVRGESTELATGFDGLRAVEIAHEVSQNSRQCVSDALSPDASRSQ
jgi:predicted dehydrogenase